MAKLTKKTWIIIVSSVLAAAILVAAIFVVPGMTGGPSVSATETPSATATPTATLTVTPPASGTPTPVPSVTPSATPTPLVTLTFNTMGGDKLDAMQIDAGTDARLIDLPIAQKENVVFDAWYTDEALTTEYYDTDGIINADTTLYAGYIEYQGDDTYVNAYDVGETSLDIMPEDIIVLLSPIELTNDNLYDHITVINQLELSGGTAPALSVEKAGAQNVYHISPLGKWPEGGMFALEATDGIKFILESDEYVTENNGAAVAASKITLLINITENKKNVTEADGIIVIAYGDYESFYEDALIVKADAASKYGISEGALLKVMLEDGTHQYIKAGKCESTASGLQIASDVALPGEVFSEFDIAATSEDSFLSDYFDEIDPQAVFNSLTSNPNFVILEDLAALSAMDYANKMGIANVAGATLLSGRTIGDISGIAPMASVGNLNFIWETVAGPEVLKLPKEYQLLRTGVSFDVIYDDDTYARITLEIQTGSCYGLLTRGQSKKKTPVTDVWLNARLKADYVTVFKFNIIMYDGDNVYDASEEMNNFGKRDPESLVAKYKELINLDTERLKIIDEDLFAITFNLLDIIVLRVPFGIEVEIDLNGSFSTELINRVAHFYGINGSVADGFDFWDAHCWQMQYENTSYYGKFDVSIGVRSGITIGLAGLDTLGRVGLKAEIGVYYQFLGYGYTKSSYRSWNEGLNQSDEELKKDNIDSTYTSTTGGAMYHELGLYLQFGIYVESEILGAKAEGESPQIRIKLMEQGNLYDVDGKKAPLLPLGFGTDVKAEASKGLIVTDYGVQLESLPYYEIMYLNLKTGELITKQVDFSEFKIKDCYILYHDRGSDMLMPRRNLRDIRIDSTIKIRYVDDSLYYIDDYLTKYSVQENGTSVIKYTGAYTELEIPVTYLPLSLMDDVDKINEEITVVFTHNDESIATLDVKYGATINLTLLDKETSLRDLISASGADFLTDPNVSDFGLPTAMYNTPITEDTRIEMEIYYYGVPISVRRVSGIRENDGYLYYESQNGYIVWCNSNLNDELSELATDPHPNMKFIGWRDVNSGEMIADDRTVSVDDNRTLSVEAVYDYAPIKVTVKIERLDDGVNDFTATTYIYNLNAGESVLQRLRDDLDHKFMVGNWAMYVTEYEKYAQTFDVKFYEDATINISWNAMPTEFKVTFDPMGGSFTSLDASLVTDGVYVMDCAAGFIFSNDLKDMLKPEKEDATANYRFAGWYYINENGEKETDIGAVYEDRTYYAEWITDEKYFDITLNAEGYCGDEAVIGEFITGKPTHIISLKYSEIQALAESIKNGEGELDHILTPTAGKYVFEKWVLTAEGDGNFIFIAYYKEGTVSVTILSKGPCGDEIAEGKFAEGTVTSLTLTQSEWEAMKAKIDAGDHSDLPTITPLTDAYLFYDWRIGTHSEIEYEIIPLFSENKEITITISAVGDHDGKEVPGTLSGTDNIVLRQTAADAFIDKIYNGDYSELPTVTPDSDEYIFSRWQVSYPSSDEYRITPVYTRKATATVTYDLGRGQNGNGTTGARSFTFNIQGETYQYSIESSMEPAAITSVNGYKNGLITDYACFEDEHYYYVFSGWTTSDGNTSWNLKHKDTVTITAQYTKLPKAYCITFTVDMNSPEKELFIENGRPLNYMSIDVWGAYGTDWSSYKLPEAIKQTSDDSTYTYEFSKWVSDTGAEMPAKVNGSGTYKPVFTQYQKPVVKDPVSITFDAGEGAYFLSTGSRYKTVEFAYGVLYDDIVEYIEKPIRNNANYKFYDWPQMWYGKILTESETVEAIYWNITRACLESEEDLIQIIFDAGEGAYFQANYNELGMLVYPDLDPRYYVHSWEEGTVIYKDVDPAENDPDFPHMTLPVTYFEQFEIIKDGVRYAGIWDIETPLEYTWANDKMIIKLKELVPFEEWEASQERG